MATNSLSRTRRKFVKPIIIAEQYSIGKTKLYEMLKKPEFKESIIKTGENSIRVDQDKFYELLEKIYG